MNQNLLTHPTPAHRRAYLAALKVYRKVWPRLERGDAEARRAAETAQEKGR